MKPLEGEERTRRGVQDSVRRRPS